ncbi:CheR family methyltransferase [Candidatus Methylomirabilis sp.]|jgi:chemotaxis protein methyltransferase CheR|uniref:CheR family methyltransferase n=1 Tax=Candidatus Methylomirabilis sp. TaxID=2032687 RepID=UPI003C742C0E
MRLSNDLRLQAQTLIAGRLGLDFSKGRQADLERGLVQACRISSVSAPETYLAWLATLPDESAEWRRLASHLTVGETYFFRDRALFEALEQHVLPSLIEACRAQEILRLRLWSAGSATGEEPYSLAILLDRLLPDLANWALTILATDINPDALETARRGCYREWSFRETPQRIRDRYFQRRSAETFEVDPAIRGMVTFAPLNLVEESYPAMVTNTIAMDLILCRNVLMYFTREAQRASVIRLQRALVTGGWLVVSPAEASTDLLHPLAPVNFAGAILYRKEPTSVAPLAPTWQPEIVLPELDDTLPFAYSSGDLVTPPLPVTSPDITSDLQRAKVLADQGRLEEAHELCEAALARDRLDPETHLLLASVCHERGDIPAALEALRRAVYLAPDSASAHFLLGSLLLRQGQRKRGRRSMETVVSLLSSVPRDEPVAGGDGLTAGRLLETARAYLELPS